MGSMVKDYLDFLVWCFGSEENMAEFEENMHAALTKKVGMEIPEDYAIVLNKDIATDWTTVLYVKTKDGKVAVFTPCPDNKTMPELARSGPPDIKVKEFEEVPGPIQDALNREGIVSAVELPFFDIRADPMKEVKLDEISDIVLAGC
jgi:hypothetical protein